MYASDRDSERGMLCVFVGEHVGIFQCAFKKKKKNKFSEGVTSFWHPLFFFFLSFMLHLKAHVIYTAILSDSPKCDVSKSEFLDY